MAEPKPVALKALQPGKHSSRGSTKHQAGKPRPKSHSGRYKPRSRKGSWAKLQAKVTALAATERQQNCQTNGQLDSMASGCDGSSHAEPMSKPENKVMQLPVQHFEKSVALDEAARQAKLAKAAVALRNQLVLRGEPMSWRRN